MVRVQGYYEFVLVTETPACPAYPAYPAYRQAGGRQESKNCDELINYTDCVRYSCVLI